MVLVKLQSVIFLNVRVNIEGNLRKISKVRENNMSAPVNFLTWIMFSRCRFPPGCLVIFKSRRPGWWHSSQWTRRTFMIEWPVCFTWWYRGIWPQFDNRINFRWWMVIRLASEIYLRYHFVAIVWQWNRTNYAVS